MARMSKAETAFREKYPHTRVATEPSGIHGMAKFRIFAGDYLCAEYITRKGAFKIALQHERSGFITPDPNERSTEVQA